MSVKKFQSSGVPIGHLTTKKSFSHILENIKESAQTSFERFLMNTYNARSVLVIFQLKKNLSSNCCKPIRVLTRTKSSCSDDRLPIRYLLSNFQPNRSNFLNRFDSLRFSSLQFYQEGRRSTTWGGSTPQTPPGGIVLMGFSLNNIYLVSQCCLLLGL